MIYIFYLFIFLKKYELHVKNYLMGSNNWYYIFIYDNY